MFSHSLGSNWSKQVSMLDVTLHAVTSNVLTVFLSSRKREVTETRGQELQRPEPRHVGGAAAEGPSGHRLRERRIRVLGLCSRPFCGWRPPLGFDWRQMQKVRSVLMFGRGSPDQSLVWSQFSRCSLVDVLGTAFLLLKLSSFKVQLNSEQPAALTLNVIKIFDLSPLTSPYSSSPSSMFPWLLPLSQ